MNKKFSTLLAGVALLGAMSASRESCNIFAENG